MDTITQIAEAVCQELEKQEPDSLSEVEQGLQAILKQVGQAAIARWLEQTADDKQAEWQGQAVVYHSERAAQVITVFGRVVYTRKYYRYRDRTGGVCPLDKLWGLRPNALSAEVERIAGLFGVEMPFERASQLMRDTLAIEVSDRAIDKATQAYGQAVVEQEARWQAAAFDLKQLADQAQDRPAPLRLYAALDGTSVHVHGEGEPTWRELKVGAWFKARGQPPTTSNGQWSIKAEAVTLFTDLCQSSAFGDLFWATGVQRSAHRARDLIVLADGARWIWDLVDHHFPEAIQIVDWFHACQYLAPIAQAVMADPGAQHAWLEYMKNLLWNGQLDDLIAACQQHAIPDQPDDPARQAVTYYTNNRQRMDYPTYRAQGFHIGSGTVESAAKQLGQQRMKVPGAIWTEDGARLVAKARAARLSGQWPSLALQRRAT